MSEQSSRPPRDIIRAIPLSVGVRAEEDASGNPIIFGHFSRFNEWTEINSVFEGRFMERMAPGAFKKTFREKRPKVLFQHGRDPMVGDKPIAEIIELREDEEGAYHESRLYDGVPELIVSGLRAGDYGQSFRMEIMREEWIDRADVSDHNPLGLPERTVKEVRNPEFGPVTFPAYANTTPGVRSMTDEFVFEWLARDPTRARELIGAHDLSQAVLRDGDTQDTAPSDTVDAAPSGTSTPERRDQGHSVLIPSSGRRRSVLDV